jgi:eukaryotic-like serine/threonine-protein kinase
LAIGNRQFCLPLVNIHGQMKIDSPLPSFEGASAWLNRPTSGVPEATLPQFQQETQVLDARFLERKSTERPTCDVLAEIVKGRPTIVHFWSINSEDSKINLSQLSQLRDERRREGLRVVAVHLALSEQKIDAQAVHHAVERFNLTEPCALDDDDKVREAFLIQEDAVPAYYLFDPQGKLTCFASGSGGLEVLEDGLDQLLGELRQQRPFCPECQLFLNEDAMFCSECGLPLTLPGGAHPYYETHHSASLPTVRLADPDPLLGHRIDGKYELQARVGEGGMSMVYRARRLHIGDDVAVKILLKSLADDKSAVARFRREARAAAMLHHPNVITIHDFGEPGKGDVPAYIVMEFVKGTPLRDLLTRETQFTVERALRLMRGICSAVGAAHRAGVVHRDLKPENVIVVAPHADFEFESVKVVDFGFAKLMTDSGVGPTGMVIGTPFYMSPEQCLGETLDTRSDVYSLGAMFYELLSGKRPFSADTVSGIITKQLSEPPPPLPATLGIPRRVSVAIMNALAKEPDARPQTATDLARQLHL